MGVDRRRAQETSGKGQRLIMVHAGSSQKGFIEDAGLLFQSKSSDNRDYHTEMNGVVFKEWMEQTLLPRLDRPSCIVMDNASYHNTVSHNDRIPTSASKKEEIQAWLVKENLSFPTAALKPELLSLVKQQRKCKSFEIDQIIYKAGHECLRLPPYHSHLNPIELVWAKIKREVADENKTFKLSDVKRLTETTMKTIDANYWKKCVEHVLKIESEYWSADGLTPNTQPTTIVNLYESSDSDQ